MDAATLVALTIGGITTVSGYGAMKLNAKAKATIDEQVKLAIGDAQAKIAEARKATEKAEIERNKQIKKVEELTDEINGLKKVKQQLVDDKAGLLKNLDSATELEKTYRALSPEAFKQAIMDFKDKPEIQKLEHPEFFEPLLSRFSVTRGTAQSLYTKFANAVTAMIPKKDFDELLLETLKGADSSLAKVKAKAAAEAADAKKKAAEEEAEEAPEGADPPQGAEEGAAVEAQEASGKGKGKGQGKAKEKALAKTKSDKGKTAGGKAKAKSKGTAKGKATAKRKATGEKTKTNRF
jgi:colicin import membrane protein